MSTDSFRVTLPRMKMVLAVDHDPEVVHILEINLAHANLEVISARNGADALARAAGDSPDVVLIGDGLLDVDAPEVCRRLKESPATGHIPVIMIGNDSGKKTAKLGGGADHYINKPFDPKEVVSLVKTCLREAERAENSHPLTGLPDQAQVNREIMGLIAQDKTFAAIYADLDDLRAFNKVYGFAQGDRAIRLLAEIISEAVRLFGNTEDLVGHPGGDNFVVISSNRKARVICRRIIADFDSRVRTLYKREDLERGYIECEDRLGHREQYSIMSLRAAVVSNEKRTFSHYLEVNEAAAEQAAYLKRFPGSNCYFDLCESGMEREAGARPGVPQAHRQELKTLQQALAWMGFLTRELDIPVTIMKDCLDWVDSAQADNFTPQQWKSLKTVRDNISQLIHVVEEITGLAKGQWFSDSTVLEELNLKTAFESVQEQLKDLVAQRGALINIKGAESIQLMTDSRSLTHGLFYVLKSALKPSAPRDKINIQAAENGAGFVNIEINTPDRILPRCELAMLRQSQTEAGALNRQQSDFYLARVLVQGLGGKLTIDSQEDTGTTYTMVIPKIWQSSKEEVNALVAAAESSRNEARAQLESLRKLLSSAMKPVPAALKASLESLGYKVQELLVLCNRSLFLADDLSNRMESQQEQFLKQEVAQLATAEAFLAVSREIARSLQVHRVFEPDSARRVVKYALAIANEFRLSKRDRQTLHYAALLKDLGLVSSPEEMLERMVVPTLEKATALRVQFNLVWKALAPINFFEPALVLILHLNERYSDCESSGLEDIKIPLGARILAVAETFEALTWGVSPRTTLAPRAAIQKLTAEAGQRFDPEVVSAFARAWKRREFHASSGNLERREALAGMGDSSV